MPGTLPRADAVRMDPGNVTTPGAQGMFDAATVLDDALPVACINLGLAFVVATLTSTFGTGLLGRRRSNLACGAA